MFIFFPLLLEKICAMCILILHSDIFLNVYSNPFLIKSNKKLTEINSNTCTFKHTRLIIAHTKTDIPLPQVLIVVELLNAFGFIISTLSFYKCMYLFQAFTDEVSIRIGHFKQEVKQCSTNDRSARFIQHNKQWGLLTQRNWRNWINENHPNAHVLTQRFHSGDLIFF